MRAANRGRPAAVVSLLAIIAVIVFGGNRVTAAIVSPPLKYVALGDSIAVWNDGQSYPADYGDLVSSDLRRTVSLTNLGIGGRTSADLVQLLETNDSFRSAVTGADVVTWDIGINDLTIPRAAYKSGTCGGADGQDCLRAAIVAYEANTRSIVASIRSLNSGPNLILRTTDVYYPWHTVDALDGSESVLRPYASRLNDRIRTVSADNHIPMASVFALFNGADGSLDPSAGGFLAPDGLHPSVYGSAAIADALRLTMYEPLAHDSDSDGVIDQFDNCPALSNPEQENHDGNFVDLKPYGKMYNDTTWPNSDNLGDACDPDADNDGLPNWVETTFPVPLCPSASGPTDRLSQDTDGDLVLDAAECALGTDPMNVHSTPPVYPAADADHDGLSDTFEATLGTDPQRPDTDGDGVLDGAEFKNYNTNPLVVNTDGDTCSDGKEVASINADGVINSTDLSQMNSSFTSLGHPYIPDLDLNKDKKIDSTDVLVVVHQYGYCG